MPKLGPTRDESVGIRRLPIGPFEPCEAQRPDNNDELPAIRRAGTVRGGGPAETRSLDEPLGGRSPLEILQPFQEFSQIDVKGSCQASEEVDRGVPCARLQ